MLAGQIAELHAAKAKLVALEKSIAAEMFAELAALPVRYGFANVAAFAAAVRAAGRTKSWRGRPPATKAPGKKRKRAKITDAMRREVKQLAEAGKTGPEIDRTVGISLPSVQNIKRRSASPASAVPEASEVAGAGTCGLESGRDTDPRRPPTAPEARSRRNAAGVVSLTAPEGPESQKGSRPNRTLRREDTGKRTAPAAQGGRNTTAANR